MVRYPLSVTSVRTGDSSPVGGALGRPGSALLPKGSLGTVLRDNPVEKIPAIFPLPGNEWSAIPPGQRNLSLKTIGFFDIM